MPTLIEIGGVTRKPLVDLTWNDPPSIKQLVSSANKIYVRRVDTLRKSLTHSKTSDGLIIEPCGIPQVIGKKPESVSLKHVYCFLFSNYSSICFTIPNFVGVKFGKNNTVINSIKLLFKINEDTYGELSIIHCICDNLY